MKVRFPLVFIVFVWLVIAGQVNANEWVLDNNASKLNFVSVKADHVAEAHTFKQLSGTVSEQGEATLLISLSSVATGIDIRDERMRKMLFDTEKYPTAQIVSQIDMTTIDALPVGQSLSTSVEANLDLCGIKSVVNADLMIAKLTDNSVVVATRTPILLNADHLGLLDGVEKLREVAGLPSLSLAVPVDFSLVYARKN